MQALQTLCFPRCGVERCATPRCPAVYATCFTCGKQGYFARVCRQNLNNKAGLKHVYDIEQNQDVTRSFDYESFFISTISGQEDCSDGWPHDKCNVIENLKKYWSLKNELYVVDDVIFRDNVVLVPRSLRTDMLKIVHEGHLGIDRCKRRARQVGSDLFEYRKTYYLILVDYYSSFVEVKKLENITSQVVIRSMKEIFSRHGIPEILISDNGTQYSSREFKQFSTDWGFTQFTSSPNYPQANGKSERAVQTVKSLLIKAYKGNSDFELALLNYRNTPRHGLDFPAQLLMGRRLRCKLPVCAELLKPQVADPSQFKTMLQKQQQSKMYYDKHCRTLPKLDIGVEVICIDGKKRTRATVIDQGDTPRSYVIQNELGRRIRRNRRHLIKSYISPDSKNIKKDMDITVNRGSGNFIVTPSRGGTPYTSPTGTRLPLENLSSPSVCRSKPSTPVSIDRTVETRRPPGSLNT
ncbi:unnamed protein product [Parnassius mnemosyne]|uniref:Integrase catalytic domain-containing protein n=1 Tax=Parnassius mnemosyne TaxID=213953 RepID=A0AAV1LVF8_9NEOP